MTTYVPHCILCKHIQPSVKVVPPMTYACAAFPAGIPREILRNKVMHTAPYPGDHGIQFELKADAPYDPTKPVPQEA